MYIDTHAHLTDEAFKENREEVISSLKKANVGLVINVGYDVESSKESAFIAQNHDEIYFCAGLHPTDGEDATDANLEKIYNLSKEKKFVGIGEIGLDYHYDGDREKQKKNFVSQLALAAEIGAPVALHARDCAEDLIKILSDWYKKLPSIVLHCYSLGAECAKVFNKFGCYYAFGGAITFKNNKLIYDVVKVVPLNRVLTETDCPYMTPEPFRGKTNSPAYVGYVTEKLAALYEISSEKAQNIVSENVKTVFTAIR